MAKDWDEGNKRIEGIFGQIGLGNQDAEKLSEFQDEYEKAIYLAEQSKKKKGLKFDEIFEQAEKDQEKAGKSKDNEPEIEKP